MNLCSLWILSIISMVIFNYKSSAKDYQADQNIGTTLFEKGDVDKHCWSSEEFTLINSRKLFQDILPKVKVIDYQNDQYIELLMDYFRLCLECVKRLSSGKTKHLMLKALVDTMGGYLRTYILPLTKHSYYAGNIKYDSTKKLFQLFDELKKFLRTNGVGWTKPNNITENHLTTLPIVITSSKSSNPCDSLIVYPLPSENDFRPHKFNRRRRRRRKRQSKEKFSRDIGLGFSSSKQKEMKPVIIPLPFLDNEEKPNSAAVPFVEDSLYSLYSSKSAYILVKYYMESIKCINSRMEKKSGVLNFNRDFYDWLEQSVVPRLNDEQWYPLFGGVSRIVNSLKEAGLGKGNVPKIQNHMYPTPSPEIYHAIPGDVVMFGTTELIIIAVISALLVWLLVGLSLVCYRYLAGDPQEMTPCRSPNNSSCTVLYDKTDHVNRNTCPGKNSRQGFVRGLKDRWRKKFGKCPAECQDRYLDEERCLAAINYSSKDTLNNGSGKISQKKQITKCVAASSSSFSPRNRAPSRRKIYYSSDESSTDSERPAGLG